MCNKQEQGSLWTCSPKDEGDKKIDEELQLEV